MSEVLEQQVIERPLLVTIISWVLIISGGFGVLSLAYVAEPTFRGVWESLGVSVRGMAAYSIVGGVVQAVAGVAMLKRRAWGRNLYLIFLPLSTLATWQLYGSMGALAAVPSAIYFVAVLLLLTRPSVNDYFAGTYTIDREYARALRAVRTAERNKNDLKRVLGVISASIGAFFALMCLLMVGMPAEAAVVTVMILMFGLPALVFVGAGVLLWGRKRWLEVLGGVFAAFGGIGALYGLILWFLPQTAYWKDIAPEIEPEFFSHFTFVGFLGLGICFAGVLMLRWQLRDDREAARGFSRPT